MNLIFIHEHEVSVATAKKLLDYSYEIIGNSEFKKNDKLNLNIFNIYTSFFCQKCGIIMKSKIDQEFVVSSKKMEKKLINNFNEKRKLESVYFEDNPNVNLVNNSEYIPRKFFKFKELPIFDKNTIYIGTEEEQIQYFRKIYIDLKQKYDSLEKENDDNKCKLDKLEGAITFRKKDKKDGENGEDQKLNDAYHIIILTNSILSLNDIGWEIKFPRGEEEYNKEILKKMIIVGVVGNRNKGKSFILGKLTDYVVPQGFSISTEGISVRFGDKAEHCIAILDSAGQEVPLLNSSINLKENNVEVKNNHLNEIIEENNKEKKEQKTLDEAGIFENCLRDKLITERFLEEFIINTSDIMILVVGNITLSEQKILTRIKNSLKNKKQLYVLHNLQNYQNKKQVEDYIENTLKKLYGIKIEENNFQNIKEDYHTKYYVETDSNITHLIFINDYCDIAAYYNNPTIEFLKKNIDVVQRRTYFSVIEKCKEFFLIIQGDFLEENLEKEDFSEKDNKIKVDKKKIKLKKVFIDEIGKTVSNDIETPNYYYYTEKNDFVITVELPGPNPSIKSKIDAQREFYNFIFQGEKSGNTSDNKEERILSKNLKDKTPFKFSIMISKKDITILPNDKGNIQFYERSMKNEQGLFTFKYHIANMNGDNGFE